MTALLAKSFLPTKIAERDVIFTQPIRAPRIIACLSQCARKKHRLVEKKHRYQTINHAVDKGTRLPKHFALGGGGMVVMLMLGVLALFIADLAVIYKRPEPVNSHQCKPCPKLTATTYKSIIPLAVGRWSPPRRGSLLGAPSASLMNDG